MTQRHNAKAARETAKPRSYFLKVTRRFTTRVDKALATGEHPAPFLVAQEAVKAALALYSAGEDPAKCCTLLSKAVDARLWYAEKHAYTFDGYNELNRDIDVLSAAVLVTRGQELVAALRRSQYRKPPPAAISTLLDHYCALIAGANFQVPRDYRELVQVESRWVLLADLFTSIGDGDRAAFQVALARYLTEAGKVEESYWRRVLTNPKFDIEFVGFWSILSAAACCLMRWVPDLAPDQIRFVPVGLIRADICNGTS